MDSDRIRQVVLLRGRVQGVGLRDLVVQIARGYDVAGTVRNRNSGDRLEIDVEGMASQVAAFVDDVLANLPSFARVDAVEREPAAPRGATGFRRESTR